MARVTVEDCIDKVESPYELVLVAKERAVQLNSGIEPTLDRENDKNTVIALREIAEEKIKVPDLTDSAIHKLRKHVEQIDDGAEDDEIVGDDFDSMYKGEISKSGAPILPSKRARKIPEKIQVSVEELTTKAEPEVEVNPEPEVEVNPEPEVEVNPEPEVEVNPELEVASEETEVSLDQIAKTEAETTEVNSDDSETTNS